MEGAWAGRRGVARLCALCAVLCGLFLMHGAPATAAEGCHTAMTMAAVSPMPAGHAAAVTTPAAPAAHGPGPTVRAADTSRTPGTLCVSTPAPERTPLPAPGLLAVAGGAALALWTRARLRTAAGGTGRRGPPAGGRDLLLQVCIART
ncbi:hypothetical protein [Streptomyces cyanogenus]|uniref:Uncharacterized protein n=1 Tax=Streptomyces cyanogenus TaxID=80860 RepID=A0ABX7U125_STRCY|nr:hypothetical protein [Streptomyces cyanogenus]QTE02725.1 hypothetical protein S1361_35665 [Streptomyces cyanogenus]